MKHPYFGDVAPRDARKLAQLVREASRVLAQSLSTLDDPHLASASVLDVRPHPDASCLAVCVSAGRVLAAAPVNTGGAWVPVAVCVSEGRTDVAEPV